MKKFEFSLQKLLGYKLSLLDNEKIKLRQLHSQLQQLETQLQTVQGIYRQKIDGLAAQAREGISAHDYYVHTNYITEVDKAMKQINRRIFVQRNDIEHQTQVVLRMTQETKSLEKLEDKQRAAYQKEAQKQEEKSIEEFVSNRSTSLTIAS